MKLFYAAASPHLRRLSMVGANKILMTMGDHPEQFIPKAPQYFPDGYEMLIDSGAFSFANGKGGEVTLESWIYRVKQLKKYAHEVIALDVIGNPGITYQNFIEIRKEIPEVIPTYHLGAPVEYLFRYADATDRIAIGGMVPYKSEPKKLRSFLDSIFCHFNFTNLPRFHCFGYFNADLLENYPFYSADSTIWLDYMKRGKTHFFHKGKIVKAESLRSGDLSSIQQLPFDQLRIHLSDKEVDKLMASKIAIDELQDYLTQLWNYRNGDIKGRDRSDTFASVGL